LIPWTYKDKPVDIPPESSVAFVYLMQFEDGTKYIGKKQLTSKRKVKVAGKVRKKVTVSESNWRSYLSSSTEVKDKIKIGHKLKSREILHWCYSLGEASYKEAELQFKHRVLLSDDWINKWIYIKIYKSTLKERIENDKEDNTTSMRRSRK
jgi:hypothetical protein